jgi:hypothetical protein
VSSDGGVYIGYDESTKSGHSHTVIGTPTKKVDDITIGPNKDVSQSMIDWKIRVLYTKIPTSLITSSSTSGPISTPTSLTSSAPTSAPTPQQQDTPSFLFPLILVALLAAICISAFSYGKYRQKSQISHPSSPAISPAILSNQDHHDVFISYAHVDKPTADAVCARLESQNIRCWIAPRDVSPGKNYPTAIIEGIEGSKIMVIIFSTHSNKSEHVTREIAAALNKSLIIIPFRIEDVMLSKSMQYLLGTPHWLDAITPPLERHLDTLVITVKKYLSEDKI